MAMEAYFDESGTHASSHVVCVAGYLFETEQARKLDEEWSEALSRFGVRRFHSTECSNRAGEFKDLTREQTVDLTAQVVGIIKRRMEVGFMVTLSQTDFGQHPRPEWQAGGPYTFCTSQILAGVSGWCDKYEFNGDISYYFESGDQHERLTNQAIAELGSGPEGRRGFRYKSHSFIPKLGNGPLQAADVLAYEWYREMNRLNDQSITVKRPSRRSYDSLLSHPGYYYSHLGAADLHNFATCNIEFLSDKFGRFEKL